MSRAQAKEQAVAESERKITPLTSQLKEKSSRIQALEQSLAGRDNQIAAITDQLRQANARSASLENEIASMRRSILWQMAMKFHNSFVEKAVPHGTGRRNKYDAWLEKSRTMVNGGHSFHQTSNMPFVEANFPGYPCHNAPLSLNESLSIKFAFPVANLSEIKVLTATHRRTNSGLTLNLTDSLSGALIRTSKVRGNDILDNDYTSFRFEPIKDSANRTFFAQLKSDGEPSAAVWHSAEVNLPSVKLYKLDDKIPGCIGFQALSNFGVKDPYDLWILKNEPNRRTLEDFRKACSLFKYRPKISIVTPAWNTDEKWLRLAIESVIDQIYDNWELCIVDGGSTKQHIKKVINEYAHKDSRIKVKILKENKGIAGNSNEALSLASGDFIGFLDHDDELASFALYEIVKLLNDKPELEFIYSDEDKIDEKGIRMNPFFKPDWSPDMFLSCNYIIHISLIKKALVDKINGFRENYDGSQDYDLLLRVLELVDEKNIAHIPKILYHWRKINTSVAFSDYAKPYAYDAAKKALIDAMKRRKIEIDNVLDGSLPGRYRIKRKIENDPKITIIVPTKDKVDMLKNCINSVINKTEYKNYKILLVDNMSTEEKTLNYYDSIKTDPKIEIIKFNKSFNYSAINNFAVTKTNSEYILFLNNDTEVVSGEWLTAMLEHAQGSEVGAVGAKLIYRDNSIQHCGIFLGLGTALHPYRKCHDHNVYYGLIANITRNYSAVTAACMLTKRSIFQEVGGFDEMLAVSFNDIDYCLKLRQKGKLIVYTPYASLFHLESISRGHDSLLENRERSLKEREYLRNKWGHLIETGDPYLNPNLTLNSEDCSIIIKLAQTVPQQDNQIVVLKDKIPKAIENARTTSEDAMVFRLKSFLDNSDTKLVFPEFKDIVVSIIILTFNKAEYTYQCLNSILEHSDTPYELIIIDNGSTDETIKLIDKIDNTIIIKNRDNLGFIRGCNQGSRVARGKYLLFLNNDVVVTPKWLSNLVETLENYPKCGAVGCKLVWPNGKLQEAGSMIWRNGTAKGYGRGDDPNKPEYSYLREVDYCSGACLLVRGEIFQQLGGFDERFIPAYYEDTDLCLGIQDLGYKVVFQPNVIVYHHEFTSSSVEIARTIMETNRLKFVEKWSEKLGSHLDYSESNVLTARDARTSRKILVIDDMIAEPSHGAGYPRAYQLLKFIADLGYKTTFFPLDVTTPWQPSTSKFQQLGVEIFYGENANFLQFAQQREGFYDLILVSRPHTMEKAYDTIKKSFPNSVLIYDAEAMFSIREILRAELGGARLSVAEKEHMIDKEIQLVKKADYVMMVSESEKKLIENRTKSGNVFIWGHPEEIAITRNDFYGRKDILFVGGFLAAKSPNEDAVIYFVREIFPLIQRKLSCSFVIAGINPPESIRRLSSKSIIVKGFVENLEDYYNTCRIFIVPHRFSAGIPLKLIEAMSYGIPTVISELTASQLNLTDMKEALVAKDPTEYAEKVMRLYEDEQLWLKIHENSIEYIKKNFDPDIMKNKLKFILDNALDST